MDIVFLKCIKDRGKLRVRIISPGYNPYANCQFPRKLRVEERVFAVPISNISVANSRGKFFYRVSDNNILIVGENESIQQNIRVERIFEIPECCVCVDLESTMVFVPCGHLCMCSGCVGRLGDDYKKRCPMCRTNATHIINKSELT